MKKIIVFLSLLLSALYSIAEESNNPGSEKAQIRVDPSHAIIFTPKSSGENLREVPTIRIVRHLYDENYDLFVIQQKKSIKFSDIIKMLPEGLSETFISPCYMDEYDNLMIPTGLVYVELKSESDYPKLVQAAEEHRCIILHQIESMPSWYTLQTTLESDGDCVDVARKMHESGMFAHAEPSFAFDVATSGGI